MQAKRQIGQGDVVAMFIVGAFALGLLIFTALANLALLTRIYPNPQFVGFGLLGLEGGTIVWTIVYFLTRSQAHKGICLIGLGVDTLISFSGFMYELAANTGTSLPVNMPVIYVVGFAVVFNVGIGLCYKLITKQQDSVPQVAAPKYEYQEQTLEQADRGPGLLTKAAASILDAGITVNELAQEKRAARRERKQAAQPEGEEEKNG